MEALCDGLYRIAYFKNYLGCCLGKLSAFGGWRDGALLEDVCHWAQVLRAYSTTQFPILLSVSGVDENVISWLHVTYMVFLHDGL